MLETLEMENNWLEEQILEGINSGPGIRMTKSYWKNSKPGCAANAMSASPKPREAPH